MPQPTTIDFWNHFILLTWQPCHVHYHLFDNMSHFIFCNCERCCLIKMLTHFIWQHVYYYLLVNIRHLYLIVLNNDVWFMLNYFILLTWQLSQVHYNVTKFINVIICDFLDFANLNNDVWSVKPYEKLPVARETGSITSESAKLLQWVNYSFNSLRPSDVRTSAGREGADLIHLNIFSISLGAKSPAHTELHV